MTAVAVFVAISPAAKAARLKDISSWKGVRENQIIGYGLIVGLRGTGDSQATEFTTQSLTSMLATMGISVAPASIQVENVAAVMVTGSLPPFARTGSRIDAQVSSLGDAKSLEGGTLLMTPMYGADGEVYAIAQGPVSVGGFLLAVGGTGVQKNHPTVGRLANGAIVERELDFNIAGRTHFEMALSNADFTTALRAAGVINAHFAAPVADARDSRTLVLTVPEMFRGNPVGFLAAVERLEVVPDAIAKIVLNERTGTIVMGEAVRISTVAVAHGSLTVTVSTTNQVSQPAPLSRGETTVLSNRDVEVFEETRRLTVIEEAVSLGDLVRGLNAMGVTPRDLIAILQAIKIAGALSADLELM